MKYEIYKNSTVKVHVDVTPELFEKALDYAFTIKVKDVTVKGFRKGKVPRGKFETEFGVESLYEEAINYLAGTKFDEFLNTNKDVDVIDGPSIDDLDFSKVKRNSNFSFSLIIPVYPEVTLGNYISLEVKAKDNDVTDREVEKEINTLSAKDKTFVTLDEEAILSLNDYAVFDFEGFKDGVAFAGGKAEKHEMQIGSGQFIPGFEEQMVGMKKGEEKDIHVTFPKDYHSEELKGANTVFKIKLHEIKKEQTVELTDEWVKSLNKEGVNTVEELKKSIRVDLLAKKHDAEEHRVIDELVSLACENAKVELPIKLVNQEIKQMEENVTNQAKQYNLDLDTFIQITGSNKELFNKQIKEAAEKRTKERLVLAAIAKKEDFAFADSEFESRYQAIAEHYQMDVNEVKKLLPKEHLAKDFGIQKAIEFLQSKAVYK